MTAPDPAELTRRYPLKDWLDDFEFLAASKAVAEPQHARQILQDRFYERCPDDPNSDENAERLLAAFYFLGRHLEELDAGGAVVMGLSGDLISNPLSATLYRIFMSVETSQLELDADVAWVLSEVSKQKKFMEGGLS